MYNFDKEILRKNTDCAKWDMNPAAADEKMISMWVADMDFEVLPEVKKALHERVEHGVFGYSFAGREFKDAVISWMERRHDWEVRQEWMVPVSGIVPGLKAAVNTFTQPGDEVLVFKPVYYPFDLSVEENGRKLIPFEMTLKDGHYELDFEALDKFLEQHSIVMAILCSPHNPVGKVWSEEEQKKLGALLKKYGIFTVSDEIHMDLVHQGYRHIPFLKANPDMAGQTIVCTAPSKTFNLAGLQTSVLVVPDEQNRKKLNRYISRSGMTPPGILGMTAATAAYTHGDQWVDELNDYVWGNMMFMKEWLAEKFPEIKVIDPQGLYLLWADFRALNLDSKELEKAMLEEAHLWLDEGYIFGSSGAGFERFNLACPRSTVKKALEQLEPVLQKYLRKE
ncbi:MAG: pyridoxal phosphate-dependent aminotransferase [Erysipelotrichaceae bacterium]|nr:pyridoxal phosphate-dependent aminotransferase [Erysipelotrichaceae bacterium]